MTILMISSDEGVRAIAPSERERKCAMLLHAHCTMICQQRVTRILASGDGFRILDDSFLAVHNCGDLKKKIVFFFNFKAHNHCVHYIVVDCSTCTN